MSDSPQIDGLIRVSRVGGRKGDSYIAEEIQQNEIQAWADRHGYTIAQWLVERDQSGHDEDRDVLELAIERAEAGTTAGFGGIRIDRFARNTRLFLTLLRRAQENDWNLIVTSLGLDLSTPNGRLVATQLAAIAEWEWEQRRESWRTAKEYAIKRGVYIAGRVPIGYLRGDDRRLVIDPALGPIITELFELRAERMLTWTALADWLGKQTGRSFCHTTVTGIIRNRAYLGESRQGDIVNPKAHPPLTTPALWKAAQQKRRGVRPSKPEWVSAASTLVGLARCSGCGRTLKVTGSATQHRGPGKKHYYYCRRRTKDGLCDVAAKAPGPALDAYVETFFLTALETDPLILQAVAAHDRAQEAAARVKDAEDQLHEYLSDPTRRARLGRDAYNTGLEAHQTYLDLQQMELAAAQEQAALPKDLPPGNLREAWPHLSVDHKRRVLNAYLDRVVVGRSTRRATPLEGRVQIVWRGNVLAGANPDDTGSKLAQDSSPRQPSSLARR